MSKKSCIFALSKGSGKRKRLAGREEAAGSREEVAGRQEEVAGRRKAAGTKHVSSNWQFLVAPYVGL